MPPVDIAITLLLFLAGELSAIWLWNRMGWFE